MRPCVVTLYQNDGAGGASVSCQISANLASLGQLGWTIDEQLTKLQPGGFSCKVWDEGGTVWAWIQDQIATAGGARLFAPWLQLTVGGVQRFLGVVDLASCRRDERDLQVELQADDWSVLLRDVILDGKAWERPLPKVASTRPGAGPWTAKCIKGSDMLQLTEQPDLQKDDVMLYGAEEYVVHSCFDLFGIWIVRLIGWTSSGKPATFPIYRKSASTGESLYYSVTANLKPADDQPSIVAVPLDTVEHLTPGDVMLTTSDAELKILDVDAERRTITLTEPLTTELRDGDKLYLSEDSRRTLVHVDAWRLVESAAAPYTVDLSRFTPAVLPRPILSWVPTDGDAPRITQASDAEPTLDGLRFFAAGGSWTGTIEGGWTFSQSTSPRHVDWTSQLASAPYSLMVDESAALAPYQDRRNRAYGTWKAGRSREVDGSWNPLSRDEDEGRSLWWTGYALAHDCAGRRRMRVTNPNTKTGTSTWQEAAWDGSTWGAWSSAASWPVAGWHPCEIAPMIGVPHASGTGCAILALAANSSGALQLQLVRGAGAEATCALAAGMQGAKLCTTPWGVYLLGSGGYGRVSYAGGVLSLAWSNVRDTGTTLLPSTFAALDDSGIYVCARVSGTDDEGKTLTETWLLHLTATPTDGASPVLWSDRVYAGVPRLAMALRDPSCPTRLVGILGSRVFQVSATLPRTVERVSAYGLTGAELLEHVAQLQLAVVVPRPDGVLQVISRGESSSATALTVDTSKLTSQRISAHFFSVVRVGGKEEDAYADAFGPVQGGRALEISDHPLVASPGQAYGVASAYAAWFGRPRRQWEATWVHEDPGTAPPWEALGPWQKIAEGGRTARLIGLSEDIVKGEAKATLLEEV
jgi:hypothetical protein